MSWQIEPDYEANSTLLGLASMIKQGVFSFIIPIANVVNEVRAAKGSIGVSLVLNIAFLPARTFMTTDMNISIIFVLSPKID